MIRIFTAPLRYIFPQRANLRIKKHYSIKLVVIGRSEEYMWKHCNKSYHCHCPKIMHRTFETFVLWTSSEKKVQTAYVKVSDHELISENSLPLATCPHFKVFIIHGYMVSMCGEES